MKKQKKLYGIIFSIIILSSTCITPFAKNDIHSDINSPENIIWQYTIYDDETCQNMVTSGTIPPASTRLSWSGITLKNGQTAEFTP